MPLSFLALAIFYNLKMKALFFSMDYAPADSRARSPIAGNLHL